MSGRPSRRRRRVCRGRARRSAGNGEPGGGLADAERSKAFAKFGSDGGEQRIVMAFEEDDAAADNIRRFSTYLERARPVRSGMISKCAVTRLGPASSPASMSCRVSDRRSRPREAPARRGRHRSRHRSTTRGGSRAGSAAKGGVACCATMASGRRAASDSPDCGARRCRAWRTSSGTGQVAIAADVAACADHSWDRQALGYVLARCDSSYSSCRKGSTPFHSAQHPLAVGTKTLTQSTPFADL